LAILSAFSLREMPRRTTKKLIQIPIVTATYR
jgi:hypothetical protein